MYITVFISFKLFSFEWLFFYFAHHSSILRATLYELSSENRSLLSFESDKKYIHSFHPYLYLFPAYSFFFLYSNTVVVVATAADNFSIDIWSLWCNVNKRVSTLCKTFMRIHFHSFRVPFILPYVSLSFYCVLSINIRRFCLFCFSHLF